MGNGYTDPTLQVGRSGGDAEGEEEEEGDGETERKRERERERTVHLPSFARSWK